MNNKTKSKLINEPAAIRRYICNKINRKLFNQLPYLAYDQKYKNYNVVCTKKYPTVIDVVNRLQTINDGYDHVIDIARTGKRPRNESEDTMNKFINEYFSFINNFYDKDK